ncbi:transmembrane protein, putative, partial [Bodo saltans]
SLPY